MSECLERVESGAWWWADGAPPNWGALVLFADDWRARSAPQTTAKIRIDLAPLPAFLTCYRYGGVTLDPMPMLRWRTGTPEVLAELARMGLRWGECRFFTDYNITYRLRPWTEGEAPTLERE